jgi:hypothetical protein
VKALDDFSVTQPDVRREPWEYLARMRSEDPVHFDKAAHSWLVTRHEDVAELARMTGNGVISQEFGWDQMLAPWQPEVDEMMIREGEQHWVYGRTAALPVEIRSRGAEGYREL